MDVRLIDANELRGIESLLNTDIIQRSEEASWLMGQILHDIDAMPTVDPETLPIVRDLRKENERLKQSFGDTFACYLMDKLDKAETELGLMKIELDATVSQLHGFCKACRNYTANYCESPCDNCIHEYYRYIDAGATDNWEWKRVEK